MTMIERTAGQLISWLRECAEIHEAGIARCTNRAGYEKALRAHQRTLAEIREEIAAFADVPADTIYRQAPGSTKWRRIEPRTVA